MISWLVWWGFFFVKLPDIRYSYSSSLVIESIASSLSQIAEYYNQNNTLQLIEIYAQQSSSDGSSSLQHKPNMPISNKNKCISREYRYSWVECENYRNIINTHAPLHHPWKSDIMRVQFTTRNPSLISVHKFALFQLFNRHLFYNQNNINIPSVLYTHLHHFPLLLLE